MTTADLTSTPCRPALAIADSSGGMVASTTAHGEATIMKVMARSRASLQVVAREQRDREHGQGGDHDAHRVALLDLLDEQLGARLGRAGLLDHRHDPGDHRVAGGSGRPRPSARRCR